VTAAIVLAPQHIRVDSYDQAALMFVPVFGRWAVTLFALSLGVGCIGAAIEITLNTGYLLAQSFGWPWGVEKPRRDVSRFTVAYSIVLCLALGIALIGIDPLQMTLISVALTVVMMPIVVLPFLVLMNQQEYVGRHTSGPIGNGLLAVLTMLGAIMALIVIPLEIFGA
jgi:Mn2+/Fe2+ NRAMP family transporter